MTRGIERLSGHVIVCGYGRIGEILCADLKRMQRSFVIIDTQVERFEEARSAGFLCLSGDATQDNVLEAAGIRRAAVLVSALPSDADNVFITLTARNLNSAIRIISRAEQSSTGPKLMQAGADKVVMPALISAHRMERMITRPSTAHLVELVTESSFLDYELDEVRLPADSVLVGCSVGTTEAHRRHKLLVVAVNQSGGTMVFNPDSGYVFRAGDTALVMGRMEDISAFRRECGL